ncbi:MAG: Pyridinium-3,5-biscarboxylic acid mononucleotide sulfurtransferase [Verrucomicrobiae bacterium]|nr:Pyridinium-3,5-biscarboxylic acid mononucleotide sulfurtransferase [Verrucomicrobiae bacterium]
MATKLDNLHALLRSCGRTLVAYSGGVDSVLLAKVAHDVLGAQTLAVIADSPSLPRRELKDAMAIAARFGFPVRVIKTNEMTDQNYTSNPVNRCYFCKSELFDELHGLAKAEGWATIVYGENSSDMGDFRPGAVAAREYQVRAPLKEVGLTKAEIRELSAKLGLPTADKPQMACLSSRIPYGEPVTDEALAMIEAAENVLRDAGFYDVRVRHHKTIARIEVGPEEMSRFLEDELREAVAKSLQVIGYAYVTLDLQGYRRGSTNEVVMKTKGTRG